MIRTRDFVVFAGLLVALLVCGGTVTVFKIFDQTDQVATIAVAFDPQAAPVVEKEAVVVVPEEEDRATALATMRQKVTERLGETGESTLPTSEPPVEEGEESPEEVAPASVQLCATYSSVSWSDVPGARFKEVEGARVLYRPAVNSTRSTAVADPTGVPAAAEEVLAQLPLRSLPLPSPTCIPQDVIGIALDGSLIRNDEVGLYRVFSADTLIGYTLDGFPLYGVSALPTDDCGGVVVGGVYRYYLSNERDTVVQCFAGVPVGL